MDDSSLLILEFPSWLYLDTNLDSLVTHDIPIFVSRKKTRFLVELSAKALTPPPLVVSGINAFLYIYVQWTMIF